MNLLIFMEQFPDEDSCLSHLREVRKEGRSLQEVRHVDHVNNFEKVYIPNAKRTLLGIYQKIKVKHLKNYLDKFCNKLNRRYFEERLFDRLPIDVNTCYWYVTGKQFFN